jgi:arginase
LKRPAPDREPGVRRLPAWLRQHGLHDLLQPAKEATLEAPAYNGIKDRETGVLNTAELIEYSRKLANGVEAELGKGQFLLLLGGDCSIALGVGLGLARKGNYGLFYLDGHTDFMPVEFSSTGGAGGMAASMLAGHGPASLCRMEDRTHYIKEELIWCVGNREYDNDYEDFVRKSNAVYKPLHIMREEGMEAIARGFLRQMERAQVDGFWIHFDVDVLNDNIMPCVDSPTPDGLSYEEWRRLIVPLVMHPLCVGLTLTILDPDLDPDATYTIPFIKEFAGIFGV